MMGLRSLARRREALVRRSAACRMQIAAGLEPLARKLAAADRAVAAVRSHPVLAGIAASALALIGPRALLRWTLRAMPVYSLLRRR